MKEPNRVRKNDIKYNVVLNEEQKQAKQLIIDNQIVSKTGAVERYFKKSFINF